MIARLESITDETPHKFSSRERLELYYTSPVIKFFLNTITYLIFLCKWQETERERERERERDRERERESEGAIERDRVRERRIESLSLSFWER